MPDFIVNVHFIFREGAPCKIKHLISGRLSMQTAVPFPVNVLFRYKGAVP